MEAEIVAEAGEQGRVTVATNMAGRGTDIKLAETVLPKTEGGTPLMATFEKYCADGVFNPSAYAQAVKVTGGSTMLVLSGQVDYADDGSVANPGDMKAQALACFRHVKAQIEAGGGTIDNIARLNVYVTDMSKLADYRAARLEVFGDVKFASTLVGVTELALPGFVIEIEAIAIL